MNREITKNNDFSFEDFYKYSLDKKIDLFLSNISELYRYEKDYVFKSIVYSLLRHSDAPIEVLMLARVMFDFNIKKKKSKSLYVDYFLNDMNPLILDGFTLSSSFSKIVFSEANRVFFPKSTMYEGSHYSQSEPRDSSLIMYQPLVSGDKFICDRPSLGVAIFYDVFLVPGLDFYIFDLNYSPLVWTSRDFNVIESCEVIEVPGISLFIKSQRYPINTYGHCILDWLPEILLFTEKNIYFDWIFIPQSASKYVFDVFRLFSPSIIEKIYLYDDSGVTAYRCDQALVSSDYEITCHPMNFMDPVLKEPFFKSIELIKQNNAFNINDFPRKIYLSRNDDLVRRVKNEQDIVSILVEKGFSIPNLSKMSITDQILMFSSATHVIAPHGSGLTNIIYCNSDVRILEFLPKVYATNCFSIIAADLGFDYSCIGEDLSMYSDGLVHKKLNTTSMNPVTLALQYDYYIDINSVIKWLDSN